MRDLRIETEQDTEKSFKQAFASDVCKGYKKNCIQFIYIQMNHHHKIFRATSGPLYQFFTVYRNVNEMLRDRGFDTLIAADYAFDTFDQLKDHFASTGGNFDRTNMNFICQNPALDKLIMVYFSNEHSIGVKHILEIHNRMKIGKIFHCILVYPKGITNSAIKHLDKPGKFKVETFADDDLLINIVRHKMMPRFEILRDRVKEDLFKESGLRDHQLPRISLGDPVAKYYGLSRGDVIRIIRKSQTAGKYVSFRICN